MLPFENRPWAKTLARTVIGLSIVAAVVAAYYLNENDQLNIPEVAIIGLLLLTILPPNIAILFRKNEPSEAAKAVNHSHLGVR